ncbi:hypothetical protein DERF_001415 [Dermatophagoides farinae]|uniref:Uncharacterized protein n=1 Tax=Dermatophagoides farinae TaxID=6954 RepID=A0A922LB54_DERFA|nr:hypothetical protein DERF_001415 [Dermatophagoides farinae]
MLYFFSCVGGIQLIEITIACLIIKIVINEIKVENVHFLIDSFCCSTAGLFLFTISIGITRSLGSSFLICFNGASNRNTPSLSILHFN